MIIRYYQEKDKAEVLSLYLEDVDLQGAKFKLLVLADFKIFTIFREANTNSIIQSLRLLLK